MNQATQPTDTPDRVLVIGEALVDIVVPPHGDVVEHPGGSPANVALTLGRLGRNVELLTWFGSDPRGAAIGEWLAESNVHVHPASHGAQRTSTALARLDENGSATYEFDLDWRVPPVAELADDLAQARIVHIGSIGALLGTGGDAVGALAGAARQNALVTYDPNVRPGILPDRDSVRADVERRVAIADVVKVSDEDVAWLYPGATLDQVIGQWLADGPGLVIVTQGGEGALATTNGVTAQITAPRVSVVDTVGAGDSFMGALIDGLLIRGLAGAEARSAVGAIGQDDLTALITRCAAVAAITVSRAGANPPWARELSL